MKFSFNTRTINDVVVMELSGRMVTREPLDQLYTAVQEASNSGSRRFALNMKAVEAMDSSGLATLRDIVVAIREHQGQLKLFSVPERVMALLRITQFTRIFEIFDDEQAALASFSPQ